VEEEVGFVASQAQIFDARQRRGLKSLAISRHVVMVGNGKASVAGILARVYAGYGVLERPDVVEVSRNDLVGEYVGATATKTASCSRRRSAVLCPAAMRSNSGSGAPSVRRTRTSWTRARWILSRWQSTRRRASRVGAAASKLLKKFGHK
jgi:hypothetical protein